MGDRKLRISDSRLKEIRGRAVAILKDAGCLEAPVPIELIAERLGARVYFAPYEGDDLAGMLIRNSSVPVIAVNSAHHRNRQRFTIAHECGHLVMGHSGETYLDRSFEVIRRDQNSSSGTDIAEVEANQFAAEILMPVRFLLKDLPSLDFESDERIAALAKRYGVSQLAMSYRIANVFM